MTIQNPESLFSGFLTTQILYFCLALGCDTPILESLFFNSRILTHQIRPVLKRMKTLLQNEFYSIPDTSPIWRGPILLIEKSQTNCWPRLSLYNFEDYKKRLIVHSNVLTFRYNEDQFIQIIFSDKDKTGDTLTMKIYEHTISRESITIETFGELIFHLNFVWTLLVTKLLEHQ